MRVTQTLDTKIRRSEWFAQVNLISVAPMLQNLRLGLKKRRSGKSKVPVKQRGSWPQVFKKWKEKNKAAFFSPSENWCLPASNLIPQEREFVVDSGASMHMISKNDLNSAEMDTLTKSCSLTRVITANGEVQTHEETTVYVKELDIFLTMKILEITPAVLSLGKICDENENFYEWINGQKPRLIENGIRAQCNTENFVQIVVPGLSWSSSSCSNHSISKTLSRQERPFSTSSSSASSSPTTSSSDNETREREDRTESDTSPETCQRTKITRAPCRRRIGGVVNRAENFGDLITADRKVLSENCESRNNHRNAVVVQDLATQWIQSYPCKTKTSQETQRSFQKFLEPEWKPKVIHTDNSLEFGKACEDLSWNHCTSTPHRSETNGIAERAVRRVKEGTSAVLLQSGVNENWWAHSMECYTFLRNVTDLVSDGKTPDERRFGQPFKGPIIPFGSLVEYHPITAKDQSRIHQIGSKVLPGLFLGYALHAWWIWTGDVLIADLEELETMDASEIYSFRLDAKEWYFIPRWKFHFPVADGRIKLLGGDQDLRTSTLIRQFKERLILTFMEYQKGLFHHLTTHFQMPVKRLMIFGPCQGTSNTAITLNPESNFTRREKNHSLFHLNTLTYLELLIRIWISSKNDASMVTGKSMGQEMCLILGQVSLNLLNWKRNFQTDFCGPGERLTRKQLTSRPDYLWPELWTKLGRNAKLKVRQKWSHEKPQLDNARKLWGIYFVDPDDKES